MSYINAKSNAVKRSIYVIISVVLGVTAMILSYVLLKDDEGLAVKALKAIGIGTDVFLMLTGLGYIVFALCFKKKVFSLVASASLWLGITVLLLLCGVLWWITLIIALAMLIISTLILLGTYSEQLTVVPDNADPAYKPYKVRESEAASSDKTEEKEELPEIKSFE